MDLDEKNNFKIDFDLFKTILKWFLYNTKVNKSFNKKKQKQLQKQSFCKFI